MTKTYVALLRGINLGSRNKVSMADLRDLVVSVGAEDVQTYVQSGNVVLTSQDRPAEIGAAIEQEIDRRLGLDVTVLVRTKAELAKIVAGNPFAKSGKEPATLHVTFLAEKPSRARVGKLDPERGGDDGLRVLGREVYLYCPNGYGRSKLSNAYFEKELAVSATTRNWKTVTKLAELAGG
jgi:uncharacterized protein (DUF1697 family)